jgi:biopolymer transport protein ExbD
MARTEINTEVDLDLTPMIDMVFLLIIFFILVNDMSQQELEDLKLPVALEAGHDDPPKGRPILNVLPDGSVIWKKQDLYYPGYDPQGKTDPIRKGRPDYWWFMAETMATKMVPFMTKDTDPVAGELVDDPILIRADRNTEFKHIQKIMEVCTRQGIRIWKVQLAASEPAGAGEE